MPSPMGTPPPGHTKDGDVEMSNGNSNHLDGSTTKMEVDGEEKDRKVKKRPSAIPIDESMKILPPAGNKSAATSSDGAANRGNIFTTLSMDETRCSSK